MRDTILSKRLVILAIAAAISLTLLPTYTSAVSPAKPGFEVILDLPYGSGPGEVGKSVGESPGPPPVSPELFQMRPDGTIWVLDTMNSRVLAFKDGKQVNEIATPSKYPSLLGVTTNSMWIRYRGYALSRYDFKTSKWETIPLKLPSGEEVGPLEIRPIGAEQTAVLVTGMVYLGVSGPLSTVTLMLDQNGKLIRILQSDSIPGADGAIWRFKPTNLEKPDAVPFVLEKYHSQDKTWKTVGQGALPRRKEVSRKRRTEDVEALGVDTQGRVAVVFGEGNYTTQFASKIDSIRLMRISSRGTVLDSITAM